MVAATGTADGTPPASAEPQLLQNFIPGGFSPRHTPHTVGNPAAGAGVCPNAGASELPQLRQNADPGGLSWPHIEQRIGPLMVEPGLSVSARSSSGNGLVPVCNALRALLRPAGSVATYLSQARALSFAMVAVLAIAACAESAVRTAPYRVRPDAAEPGSLSGPFNGRVVDSTTKLAVAGALVYATWTLERGTGLSEPAGSKDFVGSTDAAGNYKVPMLGELSRGLRVTEFTLLVYKRGYIAYRSDRRFTDLGLRMDFAQHSNQVLLERWRTELSHARHLRFVGGGTAVAALTQWELADASAELDGKRPSGDDLRPGRGTEGTYIVAAQLLTEADIKKRTKYDGQFETGPLQDEPDTATYSSQHFKALGRPETWDIALRMWKLEPGKAQEQYEQLSGQLPGLTEKDDIASRSFVAIEKDQAGNEIKGVGYLDAPRGIVILLTCGASQCTSGDDAVALGRITYDKVKTLLPISVGGKP